MRQCCFTLNNPGDKNKFEWPEVVRYGVWGGVGCLMDMDG